MARNISPLFAPSAIDFLAIVTLLFVLSASSSVYGQTEDSIKHNDAHRPELEAIAEHDNLETELEFYPLNLINPGDPVIKNEAMFDYHKFSTGEKTIHGVRFFADANTHWAKNRDMKDLIMYTEFYYGYKHLQLGMETGSVTAEEYISIGPQYVAYDTKFFRRVSLVSRLIPDLVLGYEYTTQEFNFFDHVKISSTGMGRIVFPSYQTVSQASIWASFKKIKGLYFGVEYEYNSANSYNNFKFTTNNELFFGIKAELH